MHYAIIVFCLLSFSSSGFAFESIESLNRLEQSYLEKADAAYARRFEDPEGVEQELLSIQESLRSIERRKRKAENEKRMEVVTQVVQQAQTQAAVPIGRKSKGSEESFWSSNWGYFVPLAIIAIGGIIAKWHSETQTTPTPARAIIVARNGTGNPQSVRGTSWSEAVQNPSFATALATTSRSASRKAWKNRNVIANPRNYGNREIPLEGRLPSKYT